MKQTHIYRYGHVLYTYIFVAFKTKTFSDEVIYVFHAKEEFS